MHIFWTTSTLTEQQCIQLSRLSASQGTQATDTHMMTPIRTGDIQTTLQLMRTHIEAAHMTTSSDHLAILLTLIIKSKGAEFPGQKFCISKRAEISVQNQLVLCCWWWWLWIWYGFNQSFERLHIRNIKTSKLKSNHIFNHTKKPYEVERLVVVVVVVVGSLLHIMNGVGCKELTTLLTRRHDFISTLWSFIIIWCSIHNVVVVVVVVVVVPALVVCVQILKEMAMWK
jgi:hypothetical protein